MTTMTFDPQGNSGQSRSGEQSPNRRSERGESKRATPADESAILSAKLAQGDFARQALETVLETMFFSPAEVFQVGCARQVTGGYAIDGSCSAFLSFAGPLAGTFSLVCGKDLALCLAENFHGESPSSDDVDAVVLELSNIACGNLLSELGSSGVFSLSSPRAFQQADWNELQRLEGNSADSPLTCLSLRCEQGWLTVWISSERVAGNNLGPRLCETSAS